MHSRRSQIYEVSDCWFGGNGCAVETIMLSLVLKFLIFSSFKSMSDGIREAIVGRSELLQCVQTREIEGMVLGMRESIWTDTWGFDSCSKKEWREDVTHVSGVTNNNKRIDLVRAILSYVQLRVPQAMQNRRHDNDNGSWVRATNSSKRTDLVCVIPLDKRQWMPQPRKIEDEKLL